MKPWALALCASLALHLVVASAFRPGEAVVVVPEKVAKRGDGFVSFTPVSVVEVAKLAPTPGPARVPVRTTSVRAPALSATEVASTVVSEGVGETAEVVSVTAGPETAGSAPLPDPLPAGAGRGSASAELIALVHARLAAVADRCYPAAARRFQQRGTVQLSFCIDPNGGTASTSVTQSSGAELLDAAARGCVLESAAPFPREASARCFSVPVRFGGVH